MLLYQFGGVRWSLCLETWENAGLDELNNDFTVLVQSFFNDSLILIDGTHLSLIRPLAGLFHGEYGAPRGPLGRHEVLEANGYKVSLIGREMAVPPRFDDPVLQEGEHVLETVRLLCHAGKEHSCFH